MTQARVLDRLVSFDPKSRDYPIRSVLEAEGTTTPRSYTWSCQPHLDQDQTGHCVGFGWEHEKAARPKEVAGCTNATAHALFTIAQRDFDEWPGTDYEGTSVLAGAKAVKWQGFMPEYRWAFGINDVVLTIGYKGPVVLGLNWYTGMFDTDAAGLIYPTGKVEGGHCILATGVSIKHQIVKLHQSWGIEWGIFGECYIRIPDLDRLLREDGEAVIPTTRLKVAA